MLLLRSPRLRDLVPQESGPESVTQGKARVTGMLSDWRPGVHTGGIRQHSRSPVAENTWALCKVEKPRETASQGNYQL